MADAPPIVLAIDDEPGVVRLIRLELEAQGFDVRSAETGKQALQAISEQAPDVAILDVMLPDANGLELLQQLRDTGSFPVIMLTAKGTDSEKAQGLNLGADDYLAKPFSPEELSARVRAVLRRQQGARDQRPLLYAADLCIDLQRRLVFRDNEMVSLTRTEWLLLEQMAQRPGKLVLNGDLLGQVWGPDYRGDLQYLRVWISRLRKKLEPDPSNPVLIKTVQGVGYILQAEEREEASEPSTRAAASDQGLRDEVEA